MVYLCWSVKLKVSRAEGWSWLSGTFMLGCEAQGFKSRGWSWLSGTFMLGCEAQGFTSRGVVLVEWFACTEM